MKLKKMLYKCTAIAAILAVVFSTTAVNAEVVLTEDPSSIKNGINEAVQSASGGFEYEISDGGAVITGYKGSSTTVNIPSSIGGYVVREIGDNAFKGKKYITSVTIPSGVTTIGNNAFANCESLTKMTINAKNLADADYLSADSLLNTNYSVFYNSGSLNGFEVTFGSGVTRVPGYLFATNDPKADGVYCKISKVTIPDSVKIIGQAAFECCYRLTSVTMGNGVETIRADAFRSDTALKSLTLSPALDIIGDGAFYGSGLTSITIPANVTTIGSVAFANCESLTKMTINAKNLADAKGFSIYDSYDDGYAVFYNSGSFDGFEVTFGSGVTRVPGYLFATGHSKADGVYCKISKVTIPASVKIIGKYAFYNCYLLKNATYYGTKTQWNDITIGENNGSLTNAKITYTTPKVAVTGVKLNKTALTLSAKATYKLTATVSPTNATTKTVTWTSSNPKVATVKDGTVTAVAAGTATITATTKDGNKKATCIVTVPSAVINMYRMYNPNTGEHFFTAKAKERDFLKGIGWKYEGVGWKAPSKSKTPVYRLYNKSSGDHHYTMKLKEKDALVKVGWKYEGIGWYSDDSKTIPVYREYNPNMAAFNHNYTTNKKEHDTLVNKLGWKNEGIAWYGVK